MYIFCSIFYTYIESSTLIQVIKITFLQDIYGLFTFVWHIYFSIKSVKSFIIFCINFGLHTGTFISVDTGFVNTTEREFR